MERNIVDIMLVERDIYPVPSIANTNLELNTITSSSNERIVTIHDWKYSASPRKTWLSTLLLLLRFPLS